MEKNDLMSRAQVQKLLMISGATLTKFTKSGRLSFIRIGRRILFERDQILNELRHKKSA